MKNVFKPLNKNFLIPLGLIAATSAADKGILKKILGWGTTKLITLNDAMKDIVIIVKYIEDSSLL